MTAICLLSFVLLWVFVLCFRDRALVRIYDIFMSRFSTFSPAPHYDTNNNYRATEPFGYLPTEQVSEQNKLLFLPGSFSRQNHSQGAGHGLHHGPDIHIFWSEPTHNSLKCFIFFYSIFFDHMIFSYNLINF